MAAFSTIALIGLGAASTISQMSAQRKQSKAAAQEAEANRQANRISRAGERIQNRTIRRQAAREERVRRARLIQGSSSAGVLDSSGFLGANSALTSNFGSAVARQTEQGLVAKGISAANQRAADARTAFLKAGADAESFNALLNFGQSSIGLLKERGFIT